MSAELEVLRRAHALFTGPTIRPARHLAADVGNAGPPAGVGQTLDAYRAAVAARAERV